MGGLGWIGRDGWEVIGRNTEFWHGLEGSGITRV